MASAESLFAFAAALAVFAFFPGPAVIYTAAQTIARGQRAGMRAVLGIHLGGYVHVVAATLGLSALLLHVPTVYAALKIAGAAYLAWIGFGMLRRAWEANVVPLTGAVDEVAGDHTVPSRLVRTTDERRAFIESIIIEVFNPKTALFFLSFLPQFVDPSAALPVMLQFLLLGLSTLAMFTLVDVLTVFLAGSITTRVRSSGRGLRVANAIGGTFLVVLAGKLAWDAKP
ncbi:MAG: LysE family translocator [Pseudomonadota bacterium]